jgi:thiol-disulfide isomerase/thioredoxin
MQRLRGIAAFCLLLCVTASTHGAGDLRVWGDGPTPRLELADLAGRSQRLDDYRGQVVLLNFWATWCGPCRDEMPAIEQLKKKLKGRPFVVLAVNVNEPESRVRKFLSRLPLDFPVLLDVEGSTTRAWKVRILPSSFLIARDGRIRYVATGELDWAHEQVADLVSELLP